MAVLSCLYPGRSRLLAGSVLVILFLLCCPAATAAPVVVRPGITTNPVFVTTTATATTAQTQQTVTCEAPCECLTATEAVAKWGSSGSTQCTELPCGYAYALTGAPVPKYCYRQKATTVSVYEPKVTFVAVTTTETPLSVQVPSCSNGLTYCYGKGCVNTGSDSSNCGSCGQTCTAGKVCTNGACTVQVKEVETVDPCKLGGRVSCNGACVDIHGSDSSNCGSCGWQCPAGLSCSGGECVMECPAGLSDCQYSCYDLQNDPENCGSCGNSCKPNQGCSKGQCMSLCNFKPSDFPSFTWADWQGTNWMTIPKSQGNCGSCWAEAPTGITEAMYNIENGGKVDIDLSEQWYVSACDGDMGSCLGGDNAKVLDNLRSTGVPGNDVLPWQSGSCGYHEDPPGSKTIVCNADCNNGNTAFHCSTPNTCKPSVLAPDKLWKVQQVYKISMDNAWSTSDAVEKVQQAVLCHGPLSACSGHWWHCVDIVGWQGSQWTPGGGWIIRNSWGATWNGNGYAVIPYGDPWSNNKNDVSDLINDAWAVKGVYASGP